MAREPLSANEISELAGHPHKEPSKEEVLDEFKTLTQVYHSDVTTAEVNKQEHYQALMEVDTECYDKNPNGLGIIVKIMPVNVIEAFELNSHTASVCKYLLRAGKKPGNPYVKDLAKALWWIKRELTRLPEGRKLLEKEGML